MFPHPEAGAGAPVAAVACCLTLASGVASANCINLGPSANPPTAPAAGDTIVCNADAPNPIPNNIGAPVNNLTIDLQQGAVVEPAAGNAVQVLDSGTVNVSGAARAASDAVAGQDGNTVTLSNGELTSATGAGVNIRNNGSVSGTGTISGQTSGIVVGAGSSVNFTGPVSGATLGGIRATGNNVTINHTGDITSNGAGAARGIQVSNNTTVTHSGDITSQGDGISGVVSDNVVIVNTGNITATNGDGIFVNSGGSVTQTGNVSAPAGFGIRVGDSALTFDGNISADQEAVFVGSNTTVNIQDGNTLVNNAVLSGNAGLVGNSNSTVTNRAQVTGTSGTALQFGFGTNTLTLDTGSRFNGNIVGGGGTDSLVLVGSGTEDDVFQNFESLTMNGVDWDLSAIQTITTTTVNQGLLRINGSLSTEMTVNPSGTLGGNGTVTGSVTSSGNVAPGNSIGTLTIAGDYTQNADGTLVIEVSPTGETDRLVVTNNLNLDGELLVKPLPGQSTLRSGVSDAFITYGLGPNGFFSSLRADPSVAGRVTVGVQVLPNEFRLFTFSPGNQDAYSNAVLQNGYGFMSNLTGRGHGARAGGDGTAAMVPGSNMVAASTLSGPLGLPGARAPARRGQWSGWTKGIGAFGEVDPSDGVAGHDHSIVGLQGGGDMGLNENTVLGGGLAYTRADSDIDQNAGDAEVDNFMLGGYLGWEKAGYFVDVALGGGYNDYTSRRGVVLNGAPSTASGSFDGWTFGARLAGGTEFETQGDWKFRPIATADYVYASQGSYTETGAGVGNLRVDSNDVQGLRLSGFGALSKAFRNNGNAVVPEGRVGVVYENAIDNRRVNATSAFAGPITLQGRTE